MEPPLPRLFLIRHGETEWSRTGRHTGNTDLPLTEQGEAMARALKSYLAETRFTLVLTSPLRRARDTYTLAGISGEAQVSADLAEWDYGAYEGRSSADIRKDAPGWNVFRDGCPDGETPAQVSDRADRLIARLLMLEGNIALFSHGQFGCSLAARWIGLPIVEGQHFALGPASVSMLGPKPGHPHVPVIIQWNIRPSEYARQISGQDIHAAQ